MPRFFADVDKTDSDIILTGDNARHIGMALRMRTGDGITVCDGKGSDYQCIITGFTKESVNARVVSVSESLGEPDINVFLFIAAAKNDKMDFMIQKSVEAGVCGIMPFISRYCVSRPDGQEKAGRWNKIALEAAKQCGRGIIPRVGVLTDFKTAVMEATAIGGAILYEHETGKGISNYIKTAVLASGRKKISFMIGSEGGFAADEYEYALNTGLQGVSLGSRILRCESVPLFLMGAVLSLNNEI